MKWSLPISQYDVKLIIVMTMSSKWVRIFNRRLRWVDFWKFQELDRTKWKGERTLLYLNLYISCENALISHNTLDRCSIIPQNSNAPSRHNLGQPMYKYKYVFISLRPSTIYNLATKSVPKSCKLYRKHPAVGWTTS